MAPGLWWCVCATLVAAATAQNPFTLQEAVTGQFSQRGFNGRWISDTEFTFTVEDENDNGIYVFDVPTQERRVLVEHDLMQRLATSNPILSADRQYILASSEVRQVYRYSRTAIYTLYDIANDAVNSIANGERLQLCIFGGGHSLAYVLNNNLYYLPENAASAIQITDDGIPDVVYNGHTDWVYEEDVMYSGQATWFSTEGSYLAFASFDDTNVDTYSYYYYNPNDVNITHEITDDLLYPDLVHLKYPKVGHDNPTVKLRVVDLTTLTADNITFIDLPAPEEVVTADHILGGVTWTTDNEVAAHWLNRRQNHTVLLICQISNGVVAGCQVLGYPHSSIEKQVGEPKDRTVTVIYLEEIREQSNGWVPIALPRFGGNGEFYVSLRWSERQTDGNSWQHLYVSQRVGGQVVSSSVTPGAFTVINFIGMNEENIAYYYTRTVTDQPWRSEVHMAGARDGCISCSLTMPEGGECSWATATLSTQGRYMTITCSSPTEPAAVFIVDPWENTLIEIWEENTVVRQRLLGKSLPEMLIFTVPLEDGTPAPVRLHLPPGLDVNDTDTKYPLIFYVYSGPNTNTVYETFTVGYHSYLTTTRNFIYMVADGRGSGLKGQDILYSLNNALGTVEVEDHFVILRQVLDRYQFIDRERIGIWGHSYGGYATLLTLLHDDEHLFNCGISGAPVTSWLYYNTMYTERYMGLPTEEDNLAGYQAGDVTLLADKLAGHKFLIMHGNADDNVHYQNAVKLQKALAEKNIPFEQMSYPDEAHSLAGVPMHRYNAMDHFWTKCLNITS